MMCKNSCRVLLFCLLLAGVPLCLAQTDPVTSDVVSISDALRARNFTLAINLSKAALARRPGDYRVWTLRGMATAGTGNLPLALLAYQHALKLAPTYLPALEGAAQSEFQMGHGAARPLLLKVLAQRPDDRTSHAMLGALDYQEKNCSGAVTHFQLAGDVIASRPEVLTEYGTCLTHLKRDQDAVPVFAQALAVDPSKRDARYNLALSEWNIHNAEDALATLKPLIEATPNDADASTLSAEILESKGETAHAIELLRNVILANPRNVEAYLQFATLSYDHASPQVGIDIINAGLTQMPSEPRLYLVRGILLTQFGEFARASEDFDKANQLDPQLSFLRVAEGIVQSQQQKPAEALAKFRAAVKAHPNEAYAQYLLAEALLAETKPNGSQDYEEELDAATRAVQLDPRLVAAQDLLSTVYIERGQLDRAIEHSRAALALDPNDEQAVYHLILAFRKTGRNDQLSALVKQLVQLRSRSKVEQVANKRYRLYEEPAPNGQTAP